MAERYLIASGNVSNPANWFGGNKPTVGDVAHANGFVGTIDEDISADTWTTAAGSTAGSGGGFVLLDSRTIIGNVQPGSTTVVQYNGSDQATVDGNLLPGPADALQILSTATGTVSITGHCNGGTSSTSRGVNFQGGNNSRLLVGGDVINGIGATTANGITVSTSFATGREVIIGGNVIATGQAQPLLIPGSIALLEIGGSLIAESTEDAARANAIRILNERPDQTIIRIFGPVLSNTPAGAIFSSRRGADHRIELLSGCHGQKGVAVSLNDQCDMTVVSSSSSGGDAPASYGIRTESALTAIDVIGSSVGGSHPDAHGISNESTGTVRVGGQSITNPSGALGVSNPGNGQVVIGYADFFNPVLRFITEGVTPKLVIGSWAKNATHITVANPTIDIKDASFNSVIGGPQAMTVDGTDPRLMKYEHGSNIFARGNPYFLIFGGEHEGQAIPETIHPIRF